MCVACHFPSRSSTSCLIHTEYFTLYCLGAFYPSNHKAPHNMKCSTLSAPKWLLSSAEYVNLGRRAATRIQPVLSLTKLATTHAMVVCPASTSPHGFYLNFALKCVSVNCSQYTHNIPRALMLNSIHRQSGKGNKTKFAANIDSSNFARRMDSVGHGIWDLVHPPPIPPLSSFNKWLVQ